MLLDVSESRIGLDFCGAGDFFGQPGENDHLSHWTGRVWSNLGWEMTPTYSTWFRFMSSTSTLKREKCSLSCLMQKFDAKFVSANVGQNHLPCISRIICPTMPSPLP